MLSKVLSRVAALSLLLTCTQALLLNVTTLTAHDQISSIECWQLDAPFAEPTIPGRIGTKKLILGDPSSASFDIIPARYDGGLHNAPLKQFVWWISGLVHFTMPNGTDEAWIHGGQYGLIFGHDTADISEFGHGTAYPSSAETVAMTIPLTDNITPEHTVLHVGQCTEEEMIGR